MEATKLLTRFISEKKKRKVFSTFLIMTRYILKFQLKKKKERKKEIEKRYKTVVLLLCRSINQTSFNGKSKFIQ